MVKNSKYNGLIWVVSIVIPVVVAFLFTVRIPNVEPLSFLPPIYATINGITAIILITAFVAIKIKKRKLHEGLMKVAIGLSLRSDEDLRAPMHACAQEPAEVGRWPRWLERKTPILICLALRCI